MPHTATTTAHPCAASRQGEMAVCCLGPLALFADGEEVPLRPGRARGLLQYLLMHRQAPVPRDVLMETFWPGADPAKARNSLNVAACELRRALRPVLGDVPVVDRVGDRCRLTVRVDWWLDVEHLERAVACAEAAQAADDESQAMQRWEEAADLYRGDLFADDPYTDWITPHRWRVQDAGLRALDAICRHHLRCGRHGAAADAARRLLRVDPENEDAHRTLMVCHARLQRRSLAMRQYRALTEGLGTLRLTPTKDTLEVYERILRAEPV